MNELLKMHFAAPVNQAFLGGRSDVDEMQQLCVVAHYSCRVLVLKTGRCEISNCKLANLKNPQFAPHARLGETIGPRGVSYESTLAWWRINLVCHRATDRAPSR